MLRTLLIAIALPLILAACVDPPEAGGPQGQKLGDAERTECLARGGRVGRGGLLPDELCFLPMADAGKACTKKTDCEGMCLVDPVNGKAACARENLTFGCFAFLDETGQRLDICVD